MFGEGVVFHSLWLPVFVSVGIPVVKRYIYSLSTIIASGEKFQPEISQVVVLCCAGGIWDRSSRLRLLDVSAAAGVNVLIFSCIGDDAVLIIFYVYPAQI